KKHVDWCKDYLTRAVNYWNDIIWSVESFCLFESTTTNKRALKRKRDEYNFKHTIPE
ncbi:hypothetical protein BY458DRAFT_441109, partial [Sporodiniella umbellata]